MSDLSQPPVPADPGGLAELAREHEALMQFVHLAPVGLVQIEPDGAIVMLNPMSAQLLMPLSRDGCLTNLFTALETVAPDLRALCAAFGVPHGLVCQGLRMQLTAGLNGQADARFLSLMLMKLDASRLMAVLTDITQQVARERQLQQQEAWFNAVLTGIADYALVSLDSQGRVDDWNASIGRVTGFDRDACIGRPFSLFYPADATTPEGLRDRLCEADADGWSLDNGWGLRADGTRFWGSAMITPLHALAGAPGAPADIAGSSGAGYCLVLRDITDKREAGDSVRRAALCDHLTGIGNRRAFFEAAELEIERFKRTPRPLSIALFDADYFKRINDCHGHPAGDAVLRHIAAVLAATFRQVDVVARVGGEEFAVLLPSTGIDSAAAVADRVRQALQTHSVVVDGVSIACTVSAGVAAMDDGVAGLDALMKRADIALYAAKAAGRNRVECWAPV